MTTVYVHPNRRIHVEAVLDLIAILRVLYAAELEKPAPDQARLEKVAMIAHELKTALGVVATLEPGSGPYSRVVGRLDWVLGQLDKTDLLNVAARRVKGEWKRGA